MRDRPKGSQAKTLIQSGGVWFAGGKFGVTLRVVQVVVKPKPTLESGVCHLLSPADASEAPVQTQELPPPTDVESDEDPEQEYSAPVQTESATEPTTDTASLPPPPVKGRKKVVKAEA